MRKRSHREMAAEHRAKQRAITMERRKISRTMSGLDEGHAGTIMGRVLLPGEHFALSTDDDVGSNPADPANGTWEW